MRPKFSSCRVRANHERQESRRAPQCERGSAGIQGFAVLRQQ